MTEATTVILTLAVATFSAGSLSAGEFSSLTGRSVAVSETAFSCQTADPAGNGEIVTIDSLTGLVWATEPDGAGCNNGVAFNWQSAVEWAENLTFAGYSDWRVPEIRELLTLVDYGRFDPAIDPVYFPETRQGYYWSSTSYKRYPERGAWCVDFRNGHSDGDSKKSLHAVRVVRGGGQ